MNYSKLSSTICGTIDRCSCMQCGNDRSWNTRAQCTDCVSAFGSMHGLYSDLRGDAQQSVDIFFKVFDAFEAQRCTKTRFVSDEVTDTYRLERHIFPLFRGYRFIKMAVGKCVTPTDVLRQLLIDNLAEVLGSEPVLPYCDDRGYMKIDDDNAAYIFPSADMTRDVLLSRMVKDDIKFLFGTVCTKAGLFAGSIDATDCEIVYSLRERVIVAHDSRFVISVSSDDLGICRFVITRVPIVKICHREVITDSASSSTVTVDEPKICFIVDSQQRDDIYEYVITQDDIVDFHREPGLTDEQVLVKNLPSVMANQDCDTVIVLTKEIPGRAVYFNRSVVADGDAVSLIKKFFEGDIVVGASLKAVGCHSLMVDNVDPVSSFFDSNQFIENPSVVHTSVDVHIDRCADTSVVHLEHDPGGLDSLDVLSAVLFHEVLK